MGRQGERQRGFSIVEAVLVVAVLGVIGVGGWFLYQHDRTKVTDAAQNGTPPTNQQTTTNTTTGATLDIKEWGVHMTLDNTTASMYYIIKSTDPNIAYLSLKTISAIDPDCAADKTSLGAIYRQSTQDPNTTIHIGNYWYGYETPSACINATQDVAVQRALPGYNLGKVVNTFNTLASD